MLLPPQPMEYQAIVRHPSHAPAAVVGYEALWRPKHSDPATAFKLQRLAGALVSTDLFCLRSGWQAQPPRAPHIWLHLNVFPETLDDAAFWEWQAQLPADARIVWELVETAWTPTTLHNLQRLRAAGQRIAFDDVGPTRATWMALRRFVPDIVKLDRQYVQATSRKAYALRSLLTYLAPHHTCVVAEGIETLSQIAWYRTLGVTHFQGYYYADHALVDPVPIMPT